MKSLDASYITLLSAQENKPRLLFELYLESGTLYYADERTDVTFPSGGQVYTAIDMEHDTVQVGSTGIIDSITLTIDNVNKTIGKYVAREPFRGRRLIVRRVFADLLGSADYDEIIFSGELKEPTVDQYKVTVEATAGQVLLRSLPKHNYSRQCRWELGSTECGKNITGDTIEESNAPDSGSTTTLVDSNLTATTDLYEEGILECDFTEDGLTWTERRRITSYASGSKTITVTKPFSASTTTAGRWKATPGCDKTYAICYTRYNNLINFGGFVHVR